MRRSLIVAATIAAALATAPSAGAQEPGEEPIRPVGGLSFREEVEVTVVNIVAYVTDPSGEPVTDLGPDDFVVRQDGVEREITNFQLYTEEVYRTRFERPQAPLAPADDAPTEAAAETAAEPPELRPTWIVLYVDNENIHPLDRNRVLSHAVRFVRDNLEPPVQMMVATFEKRLKIEQPFTDDPNLVMNALQDLRKRTGGRVSLEQERRDIIARMTRYRQDPGASAVNLERNVFGLITGFAEQEINSLHFTLESLRSMITSMSGLPGKKSLVYISNGLPMVPGLDLVYAYANTYEDPSMLTQVARWDQSRLFRSLVSVAAGQDVSIYAIGAGGLKQATLATAEFAGPIDTSGAAFGSENYLDSLRYMADSTGGLAIVNTNDFEGAFQKVSTDLFTYYSLGYPISVTGGDRVHNIEVEVPGHPDYTVRHRRTYVEKSLESRVRDRVLTSLLFPVDDNPMALGLDFGRPAPAGSDRWMVPVEASFPIHTLALMPEGDEYVGRAVLFVAARDDDGKQSDLVRQEHEVRVPSADYERLKGERFTIAANMLMEPGSYTVSAAIMDQVTRQASYTQGRQLLEEPE